MALGRVTVWNSGQVLTAAAQNGEFNNILNNPIALISPTTGAINFNLQTHTNLLPSALTGTSGSSGNVLTLSAGLIPGWGAGASGSSNSNPPVGSYVTGLVGLISSQLATFAADQYTFRYDDFSHVESANHDEFTAKVSVLRGSSLVTIRSAVWGSSRASSTSRTPSTSASFLMRSVL